MVAVPYTATTSAHLMVFDVNPHVAKLAGCVLFKVEVKLHHSSLLAYC